MHCFIEKLPSEILVLVMQEMDGETIDTLVEAIPRLLESTLVREYVGSRRTITVEYCRHGLIAAGDGGEWVWPVMTVMKVVSPCMCCSSKAHCINKFVHVESVKGMVRLQQLHVEHGDAVLIMGLLDCLPGSLEVLEVVITKAVRGKSKKPKVKPAINEVFLDGLTANDAITVGGVEAVSADDVAATENNNATITATRLHKTAPALRMITIVNENRWNRKRVFRSVGASVSVVKHDSGEWQRTWPEIKTTKTSLLFKLGTALGALVAQNASTLQNLGVFGIDAMWIMREVTHSNTHYNKLKLIKVSGESLARSPLWSKYFQSERREFAYGVYMHPVVVVFSPLFKDRCKVIACSNRSKAAFVSGTGVEFLRNYTFI